MQHIKAVTHNVMEIRPFRISERIFPALVLRPEGPADAAFYALLDQHLSKHSAQFDNAPVVLDLAHIHDVIDVAHLRGLLDQLARRPVSLVGVQNGNRAQIAVARAAGLIAMRGGTDTGMEIAVAPEPEPEPQPEARPLPAGPGSLIVTEPVRSGQKLFAEQGDLIVVAPVSAGAELVSVGNIHVYGSLRGRALAGVAGNEAARIFCHDFAAELVAVAGLYRTSEDFDAALQRQPVQIFLQDDTLRICALT